MLMNSKGKISCLDNVANGLVLTDLLELMKFITRLCKNKIVSAMVTLEQLSDEIICMLCATNPFN